MRRQERRQVSRDRRVGRVRQAELLEPGAEPPPRRPRVHSHARQEAVREQRDGFLAGEFHLPRPADQARPGRRREVDRPALGRIGGEEGLLRLLTAPDQGRPRARLQLAAQARLDVVRQGEVEVVAAEDEMVADRQAVEVYRRVGSRAGPGFDQGQVRRAATDVADQHALAGCHFFQGIRVTSHPGVESGLRFFEQHDPGQPGPARGGHGQFARDLVERRRDRDDQVLRLQRLVGMRGVPRGAQVTEVARADLRRRQFLHVRRALPRQQVGRAIDPVVAQPRLGRHHQPPRHVRAALARQRADGMVRHRPSRPVPRQPQRAFLELPRERLVV